MGKANLPISIDELERQVAAVAKAGGKALMAPEPVYTTQNIIRTKNQRFYLGDDELAQPLRVVIVGSAFVQNYYEGEYDPDTKSAPVCYAMAEDVSQLQPHESAPKRQHDGPCATCKWNKVGSSTKKGGSPFARECAARRRLAILLLSDKTDDPAIGSIELSASALKPFTQYVNGVRAIAGLDLHLVVTELSVATTKRDTWFVQAKAGEAVARACARWVTPPKGVKVGSDGWFDRTIVGRKVIEVRETKLLMSVPQQIVVEKGKGKRGKPVTGAKRVTVREARAARQAGAKA